MDLSDYIYNTLWVKKWVNKIIKSQVISSNQLIMKAVNVTFRQICWLYPFANNWLLLAGCGNNGCKCYLIASLAISFGKKIVVAESCNNNLSMLSTKTLIARKKFIKLGGIIYSHNRNWPINIDIIVDGLLGTGLKSAPREPCSTLINRANNYFAPIISLNIPSGLIADTGEIPGAVIKATYTQTFISMKLGLLTGKAHSVVGKLYYHDLGLGYKLNTNKPIVKRLSTKMLQSWLLPRDPCSHKGTNGHLLIIGGNYNLIGAVIIAGEAALRTGAGLVKILIREKNAASFITFRPELIIENLNKNSLNNGLLWSDVVVVGPGMGQDIWSKNILYMLRKYKKPMLWDADALNILALNPYKCHNRIITPHPGEAARLLNKKINETEKNRLITIKTLLKLYGGVIVLKGPGTLLSTTNKCAVIDVGNAGMASGGMGDSLSGIIGGLLAQRISLYNAACAGCVIHGASADYKVKQTGIRGLIATDLASLLHNFINPNNSKL